MPQYDRRLQEIYRGMCGVLRHPHGYGLGESTPQPLADHLETWLGILGQIMQERATASNSSNGDLEAELSQDADLSCYAGSR